MSVRPYRDSDYAEWRRMRDILFVGQTTEDMENWLRLADSEVLVAERAEGGLCGFAEVGVRSFAEGCTLGPAAYLEGWYVDEDVRGSGVASALLQAVERWATARGYRELASDTHVTNTVSQRAHERHGFVEVDRAVHYRKVLIPSDRP